jgi:serine/threonine-protein kinase
LAHAGLADAYVVMSVFDAGVPKDVMSKAKAAARRALEIDPDLPEAHAELCLIWPCLDRDWDAAEDAFRVTLKRQPGYWLAHDHNAFVLAAHGRFDEAITEVRRGQALEPLSLVVHHHVAWVCLLARRYDDAIAECRSAIDMDATFPIAHLWMGVSIAAGAAAHAYALAGQKEEARRRLVELQHARTARYAEPYALALACVGLGEPDEALRWLEQAYQEHSFWLTMWANVDPRMDGLRDDPRFQDLVRRLGLGPK